MYKRQLYVFCSRYVCIRRRVSCCWRWTMRFECNAEVSQQRKRSCQHRHTPSVVEFLCKAFGCYCGASAPDEAHNTRNEVLRRVSALALGLLPGKNDYVIGSAALHNIHCLSNSKPVRQWGCCGTIRSGCVTSLERACAHGSYCKGAVALQNLELRSHRDARG